MKNNCKLINNNYYRVYERTLWNRLKSLRTKGFLKITRTKNLFGLNKYEFTAEVEQKYKNKKLSKSDFLELKNKIRKLGIVVDDVEIIDEYGKAKDNPKEVQARAF